MTNRETLSQVADATGQATSALLRVVAVGFGGTGLALSVMRGTTLEWAFIGLAMAVAMLTATLTLKGWRVLRRPSRLDLIALTLAVFIHQWALEAAELYVAVVGTTLTICAVTMGVRLCARVLPRGGTGQRRPF